MVEYISDVIGIHQQNGATTAYVAHPKAPSYKGGVIVVHDIWGLTGQIRRVADRLAAEGYYAIAPDLLAHAVGGTVPPELQEHLLHTDAHVRNEARKQLQSLLAATQTTQFTYYATARLMSCFEYLYHQPLVCERVAIVGFGLGGSLAFGLSVRESRLRAAVAFDGHASYVVPELRHIGCPILAFYGETDHALTNELVRLVPRMAAAGVRFKPVVYRGAGHAFFNDTNPQTYNAEAADEAWQLTKAFLRETMV